MCAPPGHAYPWAQRGPRPAGGRGLAPDRRRPPADAEALDEALVRWLSAVEAGSSKRPSTWRCSGLPGWMPCKSPSSTSASARRRRHLLHLDAHAGHPFRVVCLLGMNDGDYPRRSPRSDFDLMALPGQATRRDRSRRDDDRQLMLEALLSARQQLYLSWTGRSSRDQSELPPSVLVTQLRDHLAQGWTTGSVAARTQSIRCRPSAAATSKPPTGPAARPCAPMPGNGGPRMTSRPSRHCRPRPSCL